MASNKRRVRRVLLRTFVAVFVIVVVVGALNFQTIVKIQRGITLFEPSKLAVNFRSLDGWFGSRLVSAGEEASRFEYDLHDLPEHYIYDGETRHVSAFIESTDTTGLIVTRGNVILYEQYFGGNSETSRAIVWSVSKSVVSALVGIALEEGHIRDIHDPVTDYVPGLAVSGYNGVSIKDVLQMSSGIGFSEDYADSNSDVNVMGRLSVGFGGSLESFLNGLENEREPGTYNRYVSSDAQVLGMVVRAATGMDLARYTQEKLWQPAGMEADAYWLLDSAGVESAFGGLNATLRDLARFGNVYLHEGFWNGQQVISKEWVRASTTADEPHLLPGHHPNSESVLGYGYQWWLPGGEENDFLAMGIYGQAIYVNPRCNIVIAKTSAYQEYTDRGEEMELESIEFFRAIAQSFEPGDAASL